MIGQTLAIFLDAYRELNSKRMFWIVLALSALVVLVFAAAGIDAEGELTLLGMQTPIPIAMPPDEFYKLMFVTFGIEIWLALAATVLAIISTASIFPDLLTGGSIDLYLSKPLGRLRLFLTKYAAALLFVTLQVAVFCVASFVIIGLRGGAWEPGILLGVPIVVCFFSYLYAVSVLFGVLTRSTVAAILLTVLAWFLVFVVHGSEIALLTFRTAADRRAASAVPTLKLVEGQLAYLEKRPPAELTATDNEMLANLRRQRDDLRGSVEGSARRNLDLAHRIVYGLKTALPKTSETTALLSRSLISEPEYDDAADDGPRPGNNGNDNIRRRERAITRADERAVQSAVRQRPVAWVVGTSLLFEAAVLGVAAWVFCRRDY